MKRDLELLRRLLFILERADVLSGPFDDGGLMMDDRRVQYHLGLLLDAGDAQAVGYDRDGSVCLRLSWQGHELLELARNEQHWQRAKNLVMSRTGGLSLEAVRWVLRQMAHAATNVPSVVLTRTETRTAEVSPARAAISINNDSIDAAPATRHEAPIAPLRSAWVRADQGNGRRRHHFWDSGAKNSSSNGNTTGLQNTVAIQREPVSAVGPTVREAYAPVWHGRQPWLETLPYYLL